MNFVRKIYHFLISRVPGIRTEYNNYRKYNPGKNRVWAWCYLVLLNVRYYVLRQHDIGEQVLYPDRNRKIIAGSESERIARPAAEELSEKLMQYDVISFDVFDTLILRKLQMPADVFYLLQRRLHYMNLKTIRIDAERKARQKRFEAFGDYEVAFEEIWEEVSRLTTIDPAEGEEAEFACERSVCYANPYFLKIVSDLKAAGKKMVVCSDMYLGEERIQTLLTEAGYPEFDHYFISGDCRKSKSDGELFEIVKNELGPDVRIIHVGDNEHSDVKQAGRHGFDTYFYQSVQSSGGKYRAADLSGVVSSVYSGLVNGHLHNGTEQQDVFYEFGYIYGGLFVTGYCQFIHEYVKNNGIDKVLFLSRDGEVLMKAYRYLYPSETDLTEYAWWSRLAAVKMCAHRFKAFYFERMIYHKVNQGYSLKEIFKTMELEHLLEEYLLSGKGTLSEETELNTAIIEDLLNFFNQNWNRITDTYREQIEEGKKYYSELIGDAAAVAVVDVGWVGSGAVSLKYLIEHDWKLNSRVYGLVAGSGSRTGVDYDTTAIEYADGDLSAYLFSDSHNRDLWKIHDAEKGHNMLVELLLSSSQGSFRGFRKNQDGSYQFSSVETNHADSIQKGILDFVKQYHNHPLHDIRISGRDAMAPILLLYQNEEYTRFILQNSGIRENIE